MFNFIKTGIEFNNLAKSMNGMNVMIQDLLPRIERSYDNSEGIFIPTKIAYNFYDSPLTLNSGDSFDLTEIMMMKMKVMHLFKALDGSIDLILNEH
jgi:hypothetical protein